MCSGQRSVYLEHKGKQASHTLSYHSADEQHVSNNDVTVQGERRAGDKDTQIYDMNIRGTLSPDVSGTAILGVTISYLTQDIATSYSRLFKAVR